MQTESSSVQQSEEAAPTAVEEMQKLFTIRFKDVWLCYGEKL